MVWSVDPTLSTVKRKSIDSGTSENVASKEAAHHRSTLDMMMETHLEVEVSKLGETRPAPSSHVSRAHHDLPDRKVNVSDLVFQIRDKLSPSVMLLGRVCPSHVELLDHPTRKNRNLC